MYGGGVEEEEGEGDDGVIGGIDTKTLHGE